MQTVQSDHKLIATVIEIMDSQDQPQKKVQNAVASTQKNHETEKKRQWNMEILRSEKGMDEYHRALTALMRSSMEIGESQKGSENDRHKDESTTTLWKKTQQIIISAANRTLGSTNAPLTPRRSKANDNYNHARKRCHSKPSDPKLQAEVRTAKKAKYEVKEQHVEDECKDFFEKMDSVNAQRRLALMYKYIKRFRRRSNCDKKKSIPLSAWDHELK